MHFPEQEERTKERKIGIQNFYLNKLIQVEKK